MEDVVALMDVMEDHNPLYGTTYRQFLAGNLSPYWMPTRLQLQHPRWPEFAGSVVWNWGDRMGLAGLASLLPLLNAWALAGCWLLVWRRPRSAT